jgi:hypothetical protein
MNKFSKIITIVFHPLLMPVFITLILFEPKSYFSLISFDYQRIIYSFIIISTILLPLSTIPVFLKLGVIKTVEMVEKQERVLPLLFATFSYMCGYFLLQKLNLPVPIGSAFNSLLFNASIVLFCLTIVSLWWKISIHMAGIGGAFGSLLILSLRLGMDLNLFIISSIFIASILGTSRLILNTHNNPQVFIGFLLGLFGMVTGSILFY